MEFKKYQHVCRLGTQETNGILNGKCYIMPKIDGTNSSCWLDENGELKCGSRNRQLGFGKDDNQGFYGSIIQQECIIKYLKKNPSHRLFGEWLKPHSLRIYQDDAWSKFYIFDVCIDNDNKEEVVKPLLYLSYDEYQPLLEEFNLLYIQPLAIIEKPTIEQLGELVNNNNYLIKENMGYGEGVVIKNYKFTNKYGRIVWAKILHDEFSNRPNKKNKVSLENIKNGALNIELSIIDKYVTTHFVEKEYAKIINENTEIQRKQLIQLLIINVWKNLINEEIVNILHDLKNPVINFKILNKLTIDKIKEIKIDLFA